MKNNKEKFSQLVSKDKTNLVEKNKRRIKYRFFIRLKNRILLWYLTKFKNNKLWGIIQNTV